MENIDIERELGWEDDIENEGSPRRVLEAGECPFTVESFERACFAGSEKVPPCPQAIVHLRIDTPEGPASINVNLFLHTRFEWKLCQFFTCLDLCRHGEKLRMNWQVVCAIADACCFANLCFYLFCGRITAGVDIMYKSINNEISKANNMYEKIMKEYDNLSKGALLFEKTRLEVEIECRNNWISPVLSFASFGISVLALYVSLVSCLGNNLALISMQTVGVVGVILALIIILIVIYVHLNRTDTRYELAVRLSYINELLENDANQKSR